MQYPHCAAKNDKASEVHQNILPGDHKGAARVDDDDTTGCKSGAEWMTGLRGVFLLPPAVYTPDDNIQNGDGSKASGDYVE